jgi:hypothetical protein
MSAQLLNQFIHAQTPALGQGFQALHSFIWQSDGQGTHIHFSKHCAGVMGCC